MRGMMSSPCLSCSAPTSQLFNSMKTTSFSSSLRNGLHVVHNSCQEATRNGNAFNFYASLSSSTSSYRRKGRRGEFLIANCTTSSRNTEESSTAAIDQQDLIDCVGTGLDVECVVSSETEGSAAFSNGSLKQKEEGQEDAKDAVELDVLKRAMEAGVLVSPFFFWGTAMVAMKEVLPMVGPFFVASFRHIPAGFLLVAFAIFNGRPMPSGFIAWLSIFLFALVDATFFQGFLAEGLQRTTAGLGSVIIDSQPLTVAILATFLFGESIGFVGVAGLVLGVIGLVLLEVPTLTFDENNFSLWGSGEWWMLLAAQSMAVGTVMVRWVTKYSDPVMATGWEHGYGHVSILSVRDTEFSRHWHMVVGGLPLLLISFLNHDPAFEGSLKELTTTDILALLYTSIFGSAISYGIYFYNATKGSLTMLSSLTFLTPMFASIFGFLYLSETFSPLQLVGASVTVAAIYMVNYRKSIE